jgi:hypothetical protein
MAVEPRVKE